MMACSSTTGGCPSAVMAPPPHPPFAGEALPGGVIEGRSGCAAGPPAERMLPWPCERPPAQGRVFGERSRLRRGPSTDRALPGVQALQHLARVPPGTATQPITAARTELSDLRRHGKTRRCASDPGEEKRRSPLLPRTP